MTSVGRGALIADTGGFSAWYAAVEPQLRFALMAAYGPERGREATAEALAWAWEHQDRLPTLKNPVAYLYRVGQTRTRFRRLRTVHGRDEWTEPTVEPHLGKALAALSERQRVAVVLVHGYGWHLDEVADLLGIKLTSVQNHLDRGLRRLRSTVGGPSDD